MNQVIGVNFAPEQAGDISLEAALTYVRAAQMTLTRDRALGLAALDDLFTCGVVPQPPLNGRLRGELVALDIAPGLTQLAQGIANRWLAWKGKRFDRKLECGDNIFTRDSLFLAHIFWPLYRGYVDDGGETYRAFTFRTYSGPGLVNPGTQVLKIDYDLPVNPSVTIRRILDELVQLADGYYLGKAHVHWWWGRWQMVAYFSLTADRRRPSLS
jgi:hypothetical protein